MSMTGKIIELSKSEECGFIQPDDGTAKVFLHADDLGVWWRYLEPGTRVRFSCIQGARGLRAYNVSVLREDPPDSPQAGIVGRRVYEEEIMAVLTSNAPSITADEITEVRKHLALLAADRGWLAWASRP
jgi:cold shock CspA family protein